MSEPATMECHGECGRVVDMVDEVGCCPDCSVDPASCGPVNKTVDEDAAAPSAPPSLRIVPDEPVNAVDPTAPPVFEVPDAMAWAPVVASPPPLAGEHLLGTLLASVEGRQQGVELQVRIGPGHLSISYGDMRHFRLPLNEMIKAVLQRLVSEGRLERAAYEAHRTACPVTPVFLGQQAQFDGAGHAQVRCCACGAEVVVGFAEAERQALERDGGTISPR